MNRELARTDMLGRTVTEDERNKRRKRRKLMQDLGLLPIGFTNTCSNADTVKVDTTKRFSRLYVSESEFLADKIKAMELIESAGDVPKELYNKITYTLKELQPIYGDTYKYL